MNYCKTDVFITESFLNENPNTIFVFGDNLKRIVCGGAAALRYHKQSYGFITKKYPLMMMVHFITLMNKNAFLMMNCLN